jgi:cation transporter-like permease
MPKQYHAEPQPHYTYHGWALVWRMIAMLIIVVIITLLSSWLYISIYRAVTNPDNLREPQPQTIQDTQHMKFTR